MLKTSAQGLCCCILFHLTANTATAGDCLCHGDVNDDGVLDVIDAVCIAECKAGDCSCCVNSCDLNCDDRVDTGDLGDDPINDPSTWLCLFTGVAPGICCPGPTGACCDTVTGDCANAQFEDDCQVAGLLWTEGASCSEVNCTGLPTGACCDLATGDCVEDVLQMQCLSPASQWSESLTCAVADCPAPPTGACCNSGSGQCNEGVIQSNCTGSNLFWTTSLSCSDLNCVVPTQDPCPCDADVNDDGVVNVLDGVCIAECKVGACSCCLSSCDVNCDQVVDANDIGDDPINDPSVWLCLFQGAAIDECCPDSTGACCDTQSGQCTDVVLEEDCIGVNQIWSEGFGCSQVSCTGPPTGACCSLATGDCTDGSLESNCSDGSDLWVPDLPCALASCPIPPSGACCNSGNGQCQDGIFEAQCSGPDDHWSEAMLCSDVACSVPPQDPCLCNADVNNDGVVNVIDGVCIAECKIGDCSCCISSCDVNCDGIVNSMDIGDKPIEDFSSWLCVFQGAEPEYCCSVTYQEALLRGMDIPTAGTWGLAIFGTLVAVTGTILIRRSHLRFPTRT